MLVGDAELALRQAQKPPPVPENETPWQQIYRETVGPLADGAVIETALEFRQTSRKLPRHNH